MDDGTYAVHKSERPEQLIIKTGKVQLQRELVIGNGPNIGKRVRVYIDVSHVEEATT